MDFCGKFERSIIGLQFLVKLNYENRVFLLSEQQDKVTRIKFERFTVVLVYLK